MDTKEKKTSIQEVFAKQLDLPKPLLIEIVCLSPLPELMNLLLACKQVYFLTHTEAFWRRLFEIHIHEEVLPSQDQTWKELFFKHLTSWDKEMSHPTGVEIKGAKARNMLEDTLLTAFTKFSFEKGKDTAYCVIQVRGRRYDLVGAGICIENALSNAWLHDGTMGHGNFGKSIFANKDLEMEEIKILATKTHIYIFNHNKPHVNSNTTNKEICSARFYLTFFEQGSEAKLVKVGKLTSVPKKIDFNFMKSL